MGKSVGEEEVKRHGQIVFLVGLFTGVCIIQCHFDFLA